MAESGVQITIAEWARLENRPRPHEAPRLQAAHGLGFDEATVGLGCESEACAIKASGREYPCLFLPGGRAPQNDALTAARPLEASKEAAVTRERQVPHSEAVEGSRVSGQVFSAMQFQYFECVTAGVYQRKLAFVGAER